MKFNIEVDVDLYSPDLDEIGMVAEALAMMINSTIEAEGESGFSSLQIYADVSDIKVYADKPVFQR